MDSTFPGRAGAVPIRIYRSRCARDTGIQQPVHQLLVYPVTQIGSTTESYRMCAVVDRACEAVGFRSAGLRRSFGN